MKEKTNNSIKFLLVLLFIVSLFLTFKFNNVIALAEEEQQNIEYEQNVLQYNLVWDNGKWSDRGGDWDASFNNYNCYAFAIGITDDIIYPGEFSNIEPDINFANIYSIFEMATFVKNDLLAEGGYGEVTISPTEPTTLFIGQTLICIRKGEEDFHFMRYDPESGYWYHKPGTSAPLRYLHHPEDMVWYAERSVDHICFNKEDIGLRIYDSEIYYITYGEKVFTTSMVNNEVTITGASQGYNISGEVEIPSTMYVDGTAYPITSIGDQALSGFNNITSISIPATVTNIGSNAFSGCTSLQSVTFASGSQLTNIGDNAFSGCTSLTSIKIPASVTTIGNQVFYNCSNLEKVVIYNQNNVLEIGTNCFVSTPNNLKIFVPNELYDDYVSCYGTSYNFEKMYFDEFGAYICGDDVETISMEDYIYCETLYVIGGDDYEGEEEYGFLVDQMAIIGFNLSEYFAHCYLDYTSNAVFSCNLKIEVEEHSGRVLLYKCANKTNYVCVGEIENGILTIPFTEIWNENAEFYLFPEEGSVDIIEFLPEDVSLEVTYKEYL